MDKRVGRVSLCHCWFQSCVGGWVTVLKLKQMIVLPCSWTVCFTNVRVSRAEVCYLSYCKTFKCVSNVQYFLCAQHVRRETFFKYRLHFTTYCYKYVSGDNLVCGVILSLIAVIQGRKYSYIYIKYSPYVRNTCSMIFQLFYDFVQLLLFWMFKLEPQWKHERLLIKGGLITLGYFNLKQT